MIKAILLDLDDTLLYNNMQDFLPRYFGLLAEFAASSALAAASTQGRLDMVQELLVCTREVMANNDPLLTNREVFWAAFSRRTGLSWERTEAFFARFYQERFGQLQAVTRPVPLAPELVQWCQGQGWGVVIATNPLFPPAAIEQRLAWAGLPVTAYQFDLVTTFDNMHATKPQAAYYQEIFSRMGCAPAEAIMVGDDWGNDIAPAAALGCHTYWITPDDAVLPPQPDVAAGYGTLGQLYTALRQGWLAAESAEPFFPLPGAVQHQA